MGIGSDLRFVAVRSEFFTVYVAFAILAANHGLQDGFGWGRGDGVENLGLFVADGVGFEGNGRLHCGEREELEEMIRDHVAKGTSGFVKTATMFHTDRFGGCDLHVVNVIPIPERLENGIGEAEDH